MKTLKKFHSILLIFIFFLAFCFFGLFFISYLSDYVSLSFSSTEAVDIKTKISHLTTLLSITIVLLFFILLCLILFVAIKKSKIKQLLLTLAYKDEVTGYSNKQKFTIDLENTLSNNRLTKYALIMLDIDSFKTFNDIFGFVEGDKVLKYIADTINSFLHEGEFFCRSSGDNFFMLIKYDSKEQIKQRLRKMMNKISEYSVVENKIYTIICYCGVYKIHPKNYDKSVNFLIDRAKLALMRIVRDHTNGYAFYNDIFRNNLIFETELENEMERALLDNEFIVYLQPKYNMQTKEICGAEALVRWEHPTKGFLYPDKFIYIFERNYFITKLDLYVLNIVCSYQSRWHKAGYNPPPISVNQSRLNLYRKDFSSSVSNMLKENDTPPELIELEITENMAHNDLDIITAFIENLHKIGVSVSMDDFGAGYSSLNMLKNIDVDVLKLDIGFLKNSSSCPRSEIIIASVIEMANKLKIKTVAEGVETPEQVEFLKSSGCYTAQGYYYSKPIPINEYESLFFKKDSFQ